MQIQNPSAPTHIFIARLLQTLRVKSTRFPRIHRVYKAITTRKKEEYYLSPPLLSDAIQRTLLSSNKILPRLSLTLLYTTSRALLSVRAPNPQYDRELGGRSREAVNASGGGRA